MQWQRQAHMGLDGRRPVFEALPAVPGLCTPAVASDASCGLWFEPCDHASSAERLVGARTGVVLVGEWWGIDSHTIGLAKVLASHGLAVFCLDFFRDGAQALPVDETRNYSNSACLETAFVESAHKMRTANWSAAVEDVRAVCSWLRGRGAGAGASSDSGPPVHGRVGSVVVMGASFGAVVSLLCASSSDGSGDGEGSFVDAAIGFYGLPDATHTGGAIRQW
jgi:dienelactone hydrolase